MVQIDPKVSWIAIISIAILSSDCRSLKIDDYGYMNTMKEMEMVAPSSKFCKFYKDFSGLTLTMICFNPSISIIFDI